MVGNTIDGNAEVFHVTVNPLTAMELTVFSLRVEGPDKDAFEIPNEYLNPSEPKVIPVGGNWTIPVKFKPNRPGSFFAQIIPESDAPDNVAGDLIGEAYAIGVKTSDYDFGKIYITTTRQGKVYFTNIGSNDVTITRAIAQSVNGDYNEITIEKLMLNNNDIPDQPPIRLRPKDTLWIFARFTPQEVKKYEMKIEYQFEMESGETGTAYSTLVGEGMVYKLIARIPKDVYKANPGQLVEIEVILEKHPDETKPLEDAQITDFKTRIFFNTAGKSEVQEVYPAVTECKDISQNGTLSDGFNCEYAKILDNDVLQIHMSSQTQAIKGFGTLLKFKMNTYLSDLDLVPLPVEFQVMNLPASNYVIVENQPGDIKINPVCVNTARLVELASNQYYIKDVVPNPVENSATIEYSIAFEAPTTITLWNSFGEKVATLVDGILKPGVYELKFDARLMELPSGVYYCKLISGSYIGTISINITK
ncbi:hypothetical protein D9V84_05925 [Bacteroidetes/Chlorobi group bacterium Naka2016]|jgi:hypothetical protein|nr:MAG: hypothetical protein D9V84_05925 [Bacteroidetes/Chlorobi group bacterium Naka2016]